MLTTTRAPEAPPRFDAQSFAHWLRKWKDAEGLEWGDIADRAGLSRSTLQGITAIARAPESQIGRKRTESFNPPINTLSAIAHALGLDLTYVLNKGGVLTDADYSRWANFTGAERMALARALATLPEQLRTPVESQLLKDLMDRVPTNGSTNGKTEAR